MRKALREFFQKLLLGSTVEDLLTQDTDNNFDNYIPLLDNIDVTEINDVVLTPKEQRYMLKLKEEKMLTKILEKYSVFYAIAFLEAKHDANQDQTRGAVKAFKFLQEEIMMQKKDK